MGLGQGALEGLGVSAGLGVRPDFWAGRRVLLTGHTGFKGAWLALWLTEMGAEVTGLALEPEAEPNLWRLLGLAEVTHIVGDICDGSFVNRTMAKASPEVVLHLAAQSLVRRSYAEPATTFATNVIGTVNVLHAVSAAPQVRAVVVVTSDKCYENVEQIWGYRESDRMGGRDPYSASKGCTELATASMRASYFAPYRAGGHPARIACGRAGNVIGGGDWSADRLIPDIVKGCLGEAGVVDIRAPNSVRPWQHVIEPLAGYLMLAERLADGVAGSDDGWNFGPDRADERPVIEVARAIVAALGKGRIAIGDGGGLHEAKLLRLDSAKARGIGWQPRWSFAQTVDLTARWYAGWASGADPRALCSEQIATYMRAAS